MITDPIFRAKQVKALKAYYKNSTERFQEWMDDIEVNQESLYPTLSFAET
jgi:hypothetical protein